MRVLIVDLQEYKIAREEEIAACTLVEGMFVRELDMIPSAYVFAAERRMEVEITLKMLKSLKEVYEAENWRLLISMSPWRASNV